MMNKEAILQVTDRGLSVFRHYLSVRFRVGKKFLNPLYKDTKASCNIYYDQKHARYKMKDFGNYEYSGDCFELVGKMTGLSCRQPKEFVEIMRIIDATDSLEDVQRSKLKLEGRKFLLQTYSRDRYANEKQPATSMSGGITINIGAVDSPYADGITIDNQPIPKAITNG